MRRVATICWILCLGALPAGAAAAGAPTPASEHETMNRAADDVRTYLERLEPLGMAGVLVVTRGGRPLVVEAVGLADREHRIAWTPATVSTIGSITKQFTGAAILRLAEQGALSVEDPITAYFADVPPDKRDITLHQLLTHSSGIVDLVGFGDFDPLERGEFVHRILAQELAFSPGEGYEYSNAGYSLLGAIVEQVTGTSYETWLRENLLEPQGLYETGYLQPRWGEGRLAQGYQDGERWGTVLERPMADDGPYWVLRANGGIHSTVWEMVRWGQALLAGRVLSSDSMQRYWTPWVDEGGGDSFYGYGWVVTDAAGTRVITHNGGNGIFFADMAIVPDADIVAVLMSNVVAEFPPVHRLLVEVGQHLLAGRPLPTVPRLVGVDRSELAPYRGTYDLGPAAEGGRLDVAVGQRADGAWELTVEPLDPRAFGALLSTRPYRDDRAARLSARIDTIVEAIVAGDLEPLAAAYRREVTAQYLAERWADELAELEQSHGALTGYRILGTAMRDGRDVTLARLVFTEGWVDRAYVWDPEAEEELLGVSIRGLEDRLHLLPGPAGSFATWDPRVGESRPVHFETSEGGALRLIVGGEATVTATREAGNG